MNQMPQAEQTVGKFGLGEMPANAPTIVRFTNHAGHTEYYRDRGERSTPNRNEAWVYECTRCYEQRHTDPDGTQYEILPDGTPLGYLSDPAPHQPAQPAVPIPLMERKLVPTAIDMLKLAPKNPVARAYVQAAVRLPVPEGLETYEAIAEWFKNNYTEPTIPTNPTPASRRPTPRLEIEIPYTEDVSGTCTYGSTVRGTINHSMSVDFLIDMIEEGCEDMDDLVSAVISNTECDGDRDVYSEDNFTHSDYEQQDSGGTETEPDRRELAERLREFLADHSPETLESLGE